MVDAVVLDVLMEGVHELTIDTPKPRRQEVTDRVAGARVVAVGDEPIPQRTGARGQVQARTGADLGPGIERAVIPERV